MGLDNAKNYAENLYKEAINALEVFGSNADYLRELAHCFVNRKY
jgi:geranylgeranyl pyrophosphate synthase